MGGNTLSLNSLARRRGCPAAQVHVLLKGIVDFSKEVSRLQKEQGQIASRLEKLKAKMAKPDYASKCPVATQAPPNPHEIPARNSLIRRGPIRRCPLPPYSPRPDSRRPHLPTPARLGHQPRRRSPQPSSSR